MNRKKIKKLLRNIMVGALLILTLFSAGCGVLPQATVVNTIPVKCGVVQIQKNDDIDRIIKSTVSDMELNDANIDKLVKEMLKDAPKKAIPVQKYNEYGDKNMLTGKCAGEYAGHSWYMNRLNNLARGYNKKLNIFSGYRSVELQRQLFNNSDKSGKMVAEAGKSRHNAGLAVDVDGWATELTNEQLAKYGLYKPMEYENWHIEPIETKGKTTQQLLVQYGLPSHLYLVKK